MSRTARFTIYGFVLVGVLLTACGQQTVDAAGQDPAKVEQIEGSELSRVTLSPDAVRRLGISTVEVRTTGASGSSSARTVVPYAAILYDSDGKTWTYTNVAENVFVREEVVIDRVQELGAEQVALLTDGPSAGTRVVTIGAAELFGTETGVGGGGH